MVSGEGPSPACIPRDRLGPAASGAALSVLLLACRHQAEFAAPRTAPPWACGLLLHTPALMPVSCEPEGSGLSRGC